MLLDIFEDRVWQMSLGERAAVEGVLSELRPTLAIEIGSAEGRCLKRIALHAKEVHSFDLNPPSLPMPDNVTLHTGDSHELLPPFLAELAERGRNVDFAMVDGDHAPEGVRQDLEDLLDSRALARAVILIHDTANEGVRQGLDAVHFAAWPKVAHVELDWIPGQLFAEPALRNELWYGIGLVVLDAARLAYLNGSVYEQRYYPAAPLLAQVRDLVVARERVPSSVHGVAPHPDAARERIAELEAQLGARLSTRERVAALENELALARRRMAELESAAQRAAALEEELVALRDRYERAERALQNIKGSASWRLTEPLRLAKQQVRRPKR